MTPSEQLARAVLGGDALEARSTLQDVLADYPAIDKWESPSTTDPFVLAVAAALTELLAIRFGYECPSWTAAIKPAPEPVYLLKSAATMKRLRHLCETESPEPLRRRRLFAPPNYLEMV